ncbi:MAG: hypothetical protein IJZ31_05910 [Bacteroidaceae bacterium]|nr:hypothetical protein [Bacteroidaceae bacterium]
MKHKWFYILLLLLASSLYTQADEWSKIHYEVQTHAVTSAGKNAPFWLVSNRHGLSSLEGNNANLSLGIFRAFDKHIGLTWAYGLELAGAYNHTAPFYIQQFYADLKYNCWELSFGSKERWSEGKHRTLSGGGLTFAPNARPIPQVRFGVNEYTPINGWIQAKGHLSYGRHTDDRFQRTHMANAPTGSRYIEDVLFHEKTAFLKIGNRSKAPLSAEVGLEMYSQFGGRVWEKRPEGDIIRYDLPHSYKEYIKALIPMAAGSDAPEMEQANVNGNILGSWHFAMNYETDNWSLRAYYEHFYEDHSGLFGLDHHYNREGIREWITYLPWRDGLYGLEFTAPQNRIINTIVYEYLTSRDQSGPILQNPSGDMSGQAGGMDWYYIHTYYQSWQHWGMSICNPHTLSPLYNEEPTLTMPNQRLRSHHIGFDGQPTNTLHYRFMGSWSKHWGSLEDPLPTPLTQLSLMGELTYIPLKWRGWQFTGALALDRSLLIGNNFGGMITIRKIGKIKD